MSKHITPITVRFGDLDVLGHVNNAVYFTYCEHARLEFFEYLGITSRSLPSVLLARVQSNHLRPVLYGQTVNITTWVSKIGTKSFTVCHEVFANQELAATLETVLVWYDHSAKASLPVPESAREQLSSQMFES